MNFQEYLIESAGQIENVLNQQLKIWKDDVDKTTPRLSQLSEDFVTACQGGKRIRGALVRLGYEMGGGILNPDIFKASAAFEIFQTAILAHDDIIDKSPTRRGKPTIYQALGGDHYAISQTISLGDIGFFLALRMIADGNFPNDLKNQAIQSFCTSMLETASGQMMDVLMPTLKDETTEEDAVIIFRLKTARYTISGPMRLGAMLAGADEEYLQKLQHFGDNLGIAFQIQDDILGVFGDEKTLGKSVTSDIEEGKNTLLIAYALKHSDKAQLEVLSKYYGQGKIAQKELNLIKKVFEDSGSLDYSQREALKYVNTAKKVIPKMTENLEHIQILEEMADFLVERQK